MIPVRQVPYQNCRTRLQLQAAQQAVDASWRQPFLIGLTEVHDDLSLHPLHVTPKACRSRPLHRHPDQHSRSLLAQFELTPKSKRGMAVSEVGEAVDPLDGV